MCIYTCTCSNLTFAPTNIVSSCTKMYKKYVYVSKWFKLVHKTMEIIHDVSVKIKRHAYTLWWTFVLSVVTCQVPRICWKGQTVCAASRWPITWPIIPSKPTWIAQMMGWNMYLPLNMAIWGNGIYVRFQGGTSNYVINSISYSSLSVLGGTTKCFAGSFLNCLVVSTFQPIRKIYVKLDHLLR